MFAAPALNPFMAQGQARWTRVREQDDITRGGRRRARRGGAPVRDVRLLLPFEVADYVDFYASEHHASNVGRLFRPDAPPLLPNWKHLPVGYHGRAGTVVVSGTDIVRPCGQRKAPGETAPVFGPSRPAGHRGRAWLRRRHRVPARLADPGGRLPRPRLRRGPRQRLVRPRHPGLGIRPARPAPGQVLRHVGLAPWVVPLAALEAARVPLPGQDPAAAAVPAGDEHWGLDIDLAVAWNGEEVSRPAVPGPCTGPRPRCSPT